MKNRELKQRYQSARAKLQAAIRGGNLIEVRKFADELSKLASELLIEKGNCA